MKIALVINCKIKKLYDNTDRGKFLARHDMQLFQLYPEQYTNVYVASVPDASKCKQRVTQLTS